MDGLNRIMKGVKEMMNELFDGVTEKDGVYRSMAEHLGVTDVSAVVEVALEGGVNEDIAYPILHFLVTVAGNIPEEYENKLTYSLNVLNNVIAVGEFPSFGNFCYYPALHQIYLNYRLPVSPGSPDGEIDNIRYYFGVLYEELDAFVDYIMFLCDNEGESPDLDAYLKYLKEIDDWNDIEARARNLSALFDDLKERMKEQPGDV